MVFSAQKPKHNDHITQQVIKNSFAISIFSQVKSKAEGSLNSFKLSKFETIFSWKFNEKNDFSVYQHNPKIH